MARGCGGTASDELCLLVVLNPGASLEGMKAMMTTGFASMDKLGQVLYQAAPPMMCGLSVGWSTCIELVLSAFFLVGAAALVLLIKYRGQKTELPFVPFLLAAWMWQLICGR